MKQKQKYKNLDNVIGYIYQISYIEDDEKSPNFNKTVYYVGQHRTYSFKLTEDILINDNYYGSGKRIKAKIYKNNGDTSFLTKDILEYPIFGQSNLDDAEKYWIQQLFQTYNKQLLNIEKGGRNLEKEILSKQDRFLNTKDND